MKKIILSILTAAFILFAGVMALQIVASERVEVVEVKTLDNKGEVATTRLWIIDHEGKQYLRAGADSGWYLRMKANPNITMTRDGSRSAISCRRASTPGGRRQRKNERKVHMGRRCHRRHDRQRRGNPDGTAASLNVDSSISRTY